MTATAESLLDELATAEPAAPAPKGIAKLRYTHDAMVDLIIANPAISQNDLARHFGYSASWVSQVIASDAFQTRLAERSEELVDPTIRATVKDRFEALVLRSLDILRQKLDRPTADIPDQLALRTLDIASRAAGYGAKVEATKVEVNVHQNLEVLGENLVRLLHRKKVEVIEVSAGVPPGVLPVTSPLLIEHSE